MRTVYSNTRHPKFVKWSVFFAMVIAVVCAVLYIIMDDFRALFHTSWYALTYTAIFYGIYYLSTITVDEEADTIFCSSQKSNVLKISNLKTVSYKESRKGKYRSLLVHDKGVGFMDLRTSKDNADSIVAQLTRLNPSIEIKHENYL